MRTNRVSSKVPSPTNLARLSHFPLASQAGCLAYQAGRLAGPVFYIYVFSLI
jgi:hypothetical protein